LSANSYDDDSLNIFSKIIPRFILMSDVKNKIEKDVTICILYDTLEERTADSLADKIHQNYPDGIKNYTIKTLSTNYANLQNCQQTQLLFLLNTDEKNLRKTLDLASKNKILTASYDPVLLQYGIDISLFLGRNIVPYINIKSILAKDIQLENVFLRVSKIYNGEAQ
jgi:hypothetical protein